jgi:hypothetical protein
LALRPRSGHLRVNCARQKTRPFVQLGGNGELVPINFATFRKLIDGAICSVWVVSCDGVGRKEYFTYKFDPPQRPDPWQAGAGRNRENQSNAPDSNVFDQIIGSSW